MIPSMRSSGSQGPGTVQQQQRVPVVKDHELLRIKQMRNVEMLRGNYHPQSWGKQLPPVFSLEYIDINKSDVFKVVPLKNITSVSHYICVLVSKNYMLEITNG